MRLTIDPVELVKDIINAELNPQLPSDIAKRREVKLATMRRIDAAQITDTLKGTLAGDIDAVIEGIVGVMRDKGMFVSGGKA